MVSFVSRGPTNVEAEMFGKTPHSKTSPKVAIFPQHSLMFRIHSLASGEYTLIGTEWTPSVTKLNFADLS